VIVAAALLLIAQAGAILAVDASPSDECADAQDQHSLNMCALEDYQAADVELNQQWAETAAAMKEADAELDREHDKQPGYYETLLEAQRAWLKYRDAHCLVDSFSFRGGSGQPMVDSFCKANLTRMRTEQLRVLIED
jgi:uncharacterized protein YecT (DUF1311 family)